MKHTLYPKTQRIKPDNVTITITEKLDGSNLAFFVKDGDLYIAQRNHIHKLSELEEVKGSLYKGLYAYLSEHGKQLQETMHPNSVVFGEWLGMGKISYPELTNCLERWYVFAKGVVDDELRLDKLDYTLDNLRYVFGGELPYFVHTVPVVTSETRCIPTIAELDELYDSYTAKVERRVEGFIVVANNSPIKYVRSKNGKLTEHTF